MGKKSSTIRVFQLAKELGVTSKDLIVKCQAEGIGAITNHMSTVSMGLAATVREWFGEGGSSTTTAVEVAPPVDVVKARAKARRKSPRKKTTATKTDGETEAPTDPAQETTAAAAPAPEVEVPSAPDVFIPDRPVVSAPAKAPSADERGEPTVVEPPAGLEELPAAAAEAPPQPGAPDSVNGAGDDAAMVTMNVPKRPPVVKPAGPKLEQPTASKLAGPKIIRVESPEIVRPVPPRTDASIRRGGPRVGRGAGVSLPEPGGVPSDPARPGGRTTRRNKRRTATAREDGRTGRAAPTEDRGFNWRTQDLREREARLNRSGGFFKSHRRDNLKRTTGGGSRATTAAQVGGTVKVSEPITIKSLSAATGVRAPEIVKKLFLKGQQVTLNSGITAEMAIEVMLELEIELDVIEQKSAQEEIAEQFKERVIVDERPRSPVVTILGHVDHGKTSLLDRIRNAKVAESEAGGITQATSAFVVPVKAGDREHQVTFIDTPGHEAFTDMRARGANVTDIVVLVVAADDGVMPQTVESINHAKAAGVPIVVALNKMDKPEATDPNIQRILGQFAEHELNPTEWGGSTEVVRTSAVKDEGIDDLLEVIDFQAQLLELKADFDGGAEGTVLEAQFVEGRGAVAQVLIQQGCLKRGSVIVAGRAYGRVRDIVDDSGKRLDAAFPSTPVAISGLNEIPDAGDKCYVVGSLKEAEAAARERNERDRRRDLVREKVSLDNIFEHFKKGQRKDLSLVIKADVQGSIDALVGSVLKLPSEEVVIVVKHAGVGGINESDILLADAASAIVIGFNVTASSGARKEADNRQVDIRLYDVIYDVVDDVTKAIEGMLEPEHRLEVLGHAEVRQVFRISKVGTVAGCYVTDGVVERNAQIRVTRDGIVIEKDRRLSQLKRFKDDSKEVRLGQECGMKIDGYDDIKVGDILECYKTTEVKRTVG